MRDIILDKLAALLEEKIDPKLRAERLKRKSKAYDNRVHKNYTAQPRDEDPPPSDDELKDMAKHYEEAKELNPTSFQPDVAAGLNKLMAGVNARKKQNAEAEAKAAAKAKAAQPAKREESTNLKDRMVEALIEARGDVTKKLGVTIPGDPKVNYGTTPVVPARGSDKAKRLAAKTKIVRNNLRSAQAETPESRRKASEEGAAKLAQLKASNRAKDRSVPGGTFRHRSGKDVEN
jgi:hypothetical protein